MRLSVHHRPATREQGFTLVEMLVVAPIAILSIATIVSLSVLMIGDALIAQDRATTVYNTQDALDRMEQDIRFSSAFLANSIAMPAGQGRDATPTNMSNTTAFATSSGTTADTLILNQAATSSDPLDPNRAIIYYHNQPNNCANTNKYLNKVLAAKVLYFLRYDDASGSTALWRRTYVPAWDTNLAAANAVCQAPWQRRSCPIVSGANCQATDEKLLENVSAFTLTYYTNSGSTTTDSTTATNLRVALTTTRSVAGTTLTSTSTLRATRLNDTTDTSW